MVYELRCYYCDAEFEAELQKPMKVRCPVCENEILEE
jgi:DNA-directed RNA polymerase subunit RPC12/RpoP